MCMSFQVGPLGLRTALFQLVRGIKYNKDITSECKSVHHNVLICVCIFLQLQCCPYFLWSFSFSICIINHQNTEKYGLGKIFRIGFFPGVIKGTVWYIMHKVSYTIFIYICTVLWKIILHVHASMSFISASLIHVTLWRWARNTCQVGPTKCTQADHCQHFHVHGIPLAWGGLARIQHACAAPFSWLVKYCFPSETKEGSSYRPNTQEISYLVPNIGSSWAERMIRLRCVVPAKSLLRVLSGIICKQKIF